MARASVAAGAVVVGLLRPGLGSSPDSPFFVKLSTKVDLITYTFSLLQAAFCPAISTDPLQAAQVEMDCDERST